MSLPNNWLQHELRALTLRTATWNPRTEPRERIRYIDVSGVDREKLQIVAEASYSAEDAPSRARKIVQTGDTIFATVRPTLRRIAQVPTSLDGEIVSTAFCVLRPDPRKLDPDFLFFSTQLDAVMVGISALETGASYPAVRDSDVLEQRIPVPPLSEQRDIAAALNSLRSALVHEAECESVAGDLKRAAMQTLFTHGLRSEAQKDTEIGPVPDSWDAQRLGEYFQIKHGFAFEGSMFRATGTHILLTPGHFSEDGGFRDQREKTKFFIGEFDRQYLLQPGDLLIAMTEQKPGLLGSAAFIPSDELYLHNQRLGLVTDLRADLNKRYLYHLMNYRPVRDAISRTSTGSKVKHTSPDRIRDVIAPIPPLDDQAEIVGVLDGIDYKIDLHKRKRAVLNELFKSLLHKLMTGEIRVHELDLSALNAPDVAEVAA